VSVCLCVSTCDVLVRCVRVFAQLDTVLLEPYTAVRKNKLLLNFQMLAAHVVDGWRGAAGASAAATRGQGVMELKVFVFIKLLCVLFV
jgi:hypothetical protein